MPGPKPSLQAITVRQATLLDVPRMAALAASTFAPTPFISVLHPHRTTYPADYERTYFLSTMARFLNTRNTSLVAHVASSSPARSSAELVGFVQVGRVGPASASTSPPTTSQRIQHTLHFCFWLLVSRLFGLYVLVCSRLFPDRSVDPVVHAKVFGQGAVARERFFSAFPSRFNVFLLVVESEWQGRGVGGGLMREVLAVAEKEGKPVVLSGSPEGEKLYRRLGFELLGRFEEDLAGDAADAGGWFVWRPREKME